MQVVGHFDDVGVAARHGVEAARDGHALGLARGDGGAHGGHVDAEAYALEPHVGDEFVDIELGGQASAVGVGRIAQVDGLEIVLGLAIVDLDGLVEGATARAEFDDVGGEADHGFARSRAWQVGAAIVGGLRHDGVVYAGEEFIGRENAFERRLEGGAQHGGVGVDTVAAPDDAMVEAHAVEPTHGRRSGWRGNSGLYRHSLSGLACIDLHKRNLSFAYVIFQA